jgi:hypothetical protein
MKVVQVRCPNCSQPIHSKVKDIVFFCENCKVLHIRGGGTKVLDYEIADFNRNVSAEKKYMPFWRVWCNFAINESRVSGGTFQKMAQFMRGGGNSGSLFVFVPASEMDVVTFKQLAMDLTMSPPRYSTRLDFGGLQRLPTKITNGEAEKVSDFVFVTIQADKPGILQDLDYTLTCQDARMVYLPFVMTESGPKPAW